MTTGNTHYPATPWGLYTQQQLIMQMAFDYMTVNGLDINDNGQVTSTISAVMVFYYIAWPNVVDRDL